MTERVWGTYELSEDEIADRSQKLAEALRTLEAKELEKKAVVSKIAGEINQIKTEILNLRNQVIDGEETGYFEAEVVKDYDAQMVLFYHLGQVVHKRPMTPDDKQMGIAESREIN